MSQPASNSTPQLQLASPPSGNPVFVATMDNVRTLLNTLSPLATRKDIIVTVKLSHAGNGAMYFYFEEPSGVLSGNAMISRDNWTDFGLNTSGEEYFGIKIHRTPLSKTSGLAGLRSHGPFAAFVECLSIFGNNPSATTPTKVQLSCDSIGSDLQMVLENSQDIFVECRARTLSVELPSQINFRAHPILVKTVMKSEYLREIFNELDVSVASCTMSFSEQQPNIQFFTDGPAGSGQLDYYRDNNDSIETFEVKQPVRYKYKMKFLQQALKGSLHVAKKSQIRINAAGVLEFQHMIQHENEKNTFIMYFINPDEEEDEAQ